MFDGSTNPSTKSSISFIGFFQSKVSIPKCDKKAKNSSSLVSILKLVNNVNYFMNKSGIIHI